MLNTVVRWCGFAALAFSIWAGIDWALAPRVPVPMSPLQTGELDETQFPFVAVMLLDVNVSPWHSAVALIAFAVTGVATLLAAALAGWLAWRGSTRPALRDLTVALALGAIAVDWFWFVRNWPQQPFAGAIPVLDYLFVLVWCISNWAMQNCFSGYPEVISRERLQQATTDASEGRYVRARRGEGFWRFWSWLPMEHYGRHGQAVAPELHGWARFVRSRELVWIVTYIVIWLIAWSYAPLFKRSSGEPGPLLVRVLIGSFIPYILLCLFDPLLNLRLNAALTNWIRGRAPGFFDETELAIRQWFIGRRGLLVAMAIGIVSTFCWQAGGVRREVAFAALLIFGIFAIGNSTSLLYINWRHGNAEQRRAIAWILLGTAGVWAVWVAVQLLISFPIIFTVTAPSLRGISPVDKALNTNITLGPALIALAFVLSLWASILNHGSFDPALALRRGAGVAVLGVVLTAVFVGVEGAASSLIVTHFGMPSASGPVIAGTVVALGFKPLRERVERRVEQVMLRLLPPDAITTGDRRVCAVLFADLSGYTRLSETDEAEAMTLAAILHGQARVAASSHGGRVVKTIGDAVLCVFDEASHALAAAKAMLRGYRNEAARHELEALPLHSGLHMGEVTIARDGDVFGASVNLAARLQSLAGADELIASSAVSAAVVAGSISAEPLPARRFKNIAEPVDCLRVRLA